MASVSLADRVFFTTGRNIRSLRSEGMYHMIWAGAFVYLDGGSYNTDPGAVAQAIFDGTLDHNNMFGSYRIAFLNEQTGTISAWGDNCGEAVFFYDADSGLFSDSFLWLVRRRDNTEPCEEAIFNVFSGVPELDCLTPVKGILTTSPDCCYTVLDGSAPEEHSKRLLPLDSEGYAVEYGEVIRQLLKAINGQKYSAVCTGGTDSRVVISAIMAAGGDPSLIISGPPDYIDTRLAVEVANRLCRPLTIIDTAHKDDGWLTSAFEFSDGWYDTVMSYRHMKKTQSEYNSGIKYEFGGLGGEFFKKYYYHKGSGIPTPGAIARSVYNDRLIPSWLGDRLAPFTGNVYGKLEKAFEGRCRSDRITAYNDSGRLAMRASMNNVSNPISRSVVKFDVLMEPRVIASARGINPKTVHLHMWHREQIAKYAPELCDIPTDQGYNCSPDADKVAADIRHARRSNTVLWIKQTGKKLSRRLAHHSSRSVWNSEYSEAVSSVEFAEAFELCQSRGWIAPSVSADQVPPADIGNILRIGLLFSPKYGLSRKTGSVS